MRFVLRYRRPGPASLDSLRLDGLEGVSIVDRSPRMLLVEGEEPVLKAWAESSPGWELMPSQEERYEVPDPRPRPKPR